jgi:pSer/pThr/pTyr-binding forkhead associated (FHA) protein
MINGQRLPIPPKAEVIIGRSDAASQMFPEVDLTPAGGSPQTGVSRRHAKLTWQGNAWMLEDLNSTNGTSLRGLKLMPNQKVQLSTGDTIIVGTLQLAFYAN